MITKETLHALCNLVSAQPFVETLCLSADVVADIDPGSDIAKMTDRDWRVAQYNDPVLRKWIKTVRDKGKPNRQSLPKGKEHLAIFRTFDKLCLQRGVLYRRTRADDHDKLQLVLPKSH
ncbi:hypothetical protein ACJMK2_033051, partial [Sinanodonta woodiana]